MAEIGRPVKFDDTLVQKLEEAFALDCSIPEACFYANISKQTYYNHVDGKGDDGTKPKDLFDRFEALRNKPILMARQTVVKALKDNPDMAMKYLERKARNEFSTRSETDHTTKGEKIEQSASALKLAQEYEDRLKESM